MRKSLERVGRVPMTRKLLHRISVNTRGASVVFLRLRRVLPDNDEGRNHPDHATGSLTPAELGVLLDGMRKLARMVHIGEAIDVLRAGRRLREPLAVLTFDESFALTPTLALPVCRAFGIPMLQFTTTEALDEPASILWDEAVRSALTRIAPQPLTVSFVDRSMHTDSKDALTSSHRLLMLSLASLDERELRRRLQELFGAEGVPKSTVMDAMINREQLHALREDPLFACGAHGHRHLSMAAASDDALADELWRPRDLLQQHAGSSFANVMSYPFGRRPYVDDRVIQAARTADYRAAFTAVPGVVRPGDHLYQLPRLSLSSASMQTLQLQGLLDAADAMLRTVGGEQSRLNDVQG
jgi:peptidoglycan/xylan/chitin deacetylase (PgdA/CDA1 family)